MANVTLDDKDIVSISELDFLRNASAIIDQHSPRVIQNYFIWRFMMNRAANMPRRYRSIREQFDRIFRGTSAERPRSITCGAYVNTHMGFAVAKLYIKNYFDENARNQVGNRTTHVFAIG
jgi:predicted metalloendopeptidase